MGGHAFRAALATVLAVAGLTVASAAPSVAVSTGRPVAIAVAPGGTSYVGFATAGRLLRLTPDGDQEGSIPLDRDDPLDGLSVDPAGNIWADYGDSVSELDTDGTLLTHFAHHPGGSCPATRAHDPAGAGGIDVTADAVYVAGRCHADVEVYGRGGVHRATIDLPGGGYPRGIAWAPAVGDLPARLYVSVPAAGKVYAYDASHLDAGSTPARTLVIQRHDGFHAPEPGGLVADGHGQLAVLDVANNALYFYNGTKDYSFYRTLGHPPDPMTIKGYLDDPTAITQGGARVDGHLWVADSGNGRVQRWSTDGTTQWMADSLPPGDPGAPVNTTAPKVTGTPTSGSLVFCSDGGWSGEPTGFTRVWKRDGTTIAGATDSTYVVTGADVGTDLTCTVTAANAVGRSAPVTSADFPIPTAGDPPYVVNRPVVSGEAVSGSVLSCSTGTWTGGTPTGYERAWLRDGQLLPGTNASQYLLTDSDVAHQVTCRVAATNAHGTGPWATSDPVTVAEGDGGEVDPPQNTSSPRITGTAVVGDVLICDPGAWDGAPTFAYSWQREGAAVGESRSDQHLVVSTDVGRSLICVVTGTNPAGADTAISPPVVARASGDPGGSGGSGGSTKTCRGRPQVTINRGATFAHDPYVVLHIRVPQGATAVTISNDAHFRQADTRTLTGSCRYLWPLPKSSTRAPKSVHVRFPGAASAGAASDRILLDSFAPVIHKITAHWSRAKWGWLLTFHVTEHGSGLAKVTYGRSRSNNETRAWGPPVVSNDSSWLQWIRVYDKAGNASNWYHLTSF